MKDPEQEVQIKRVRTAIEAAVLAFCKARAPFGHVAVNVQSYFYMTDLTEFVKKHTQIAPDSAGRILSDLRQRKKIDYRVINRAKSFYELTMVQP